MTITIELAPELQAELARQAATHGVELDVYAASLLEGAAYGPVAPDKPPASAPAPEVIDAIERLKSFGKSNGPSLGGMTIRQLRHEARP
ncbi:MAG: hypothetical protein ACLP59_05935 [Bryobacteraceae bacterium]